MSTKTLKVLIIEDRRENIIFLANNVLKPRGFEIITAMDGDSGLRKALEEKPDLIFTDLKLPNKHGLEVLAELQEHGATIPAIVMTFHGSEKTAVQALRLGAKDYLIKPFSLDDVEAALDRIEAEIKQKQPTPTSVSQNEDNLRQYIGELEETIADMEKTAEANSDLMVKLQNQLLERNKKIANWKEKCLKLEKKLKEQVLLTQEARTSAKAMMGFIRKQQKRGIYPSNNKNHTRVSKPNNKLP